jgi:hypothetical protein
MEYQRKLRERWGGCKFWTVNNKLKIRDYKDKYF